MNRQDVLRSCRPDRGNDLKTAKIALKPPSWTQQALPAALQAQLAASPSATCRFEPLPLASKLASKRNLASNLPSKPASKRNLASNLASAVPNCCPKALPSGSKRLFLHTLPLDGANFFEARATYKKPGKTICFYRFFAYPRLRARFCNPPKQLQKHAAPSLKIEFVTFLLYKCSWTAVLQLLRLT